MREDLEHSLLYKTCGCTFTTAVCGEGKKLDAILTKAFLKQKELHAVKGDTAHDEWVKASEAVYNHLRVRERD